MIRSNPLPSLTACRSASGRCCAGKSFVTIAALVALWVLISRPAVAQPYRPAIGLIPDTAAGVVHVLDAPQLSGAWESTTLSGLFDDPAMRPFIDAQREAAKQRVGTLGFNIGVRPEEVLELASGEIVAAWLPFNDPHRPFAVAVIADIRGKQAQADEVFRKVDADLKANGATPKQVTFAGETIHVYTLRPVPGQIRVEQVAFSYNAQRLVAADRESVVRSLLEAAGGDDSETAKLAAAEDYRQVNQQIAATRSAAANTGTPAVSWFARPLAMGRIIREAAKIDRGRQVDILNLLQRQGFDAVTAAGGQLAVAQGSFDLLHHGFILANPAGSDPDRFQLAARALRPVNLPAEPIPSWVGDSVASFSQLNWNLTDSFWHVESLVNDAFGEEIFRDMLDGIRDDEDGPQIDIAEDVIPNLGQRVYVVTDNVLPADQRSERMLLAIEIKQAAVLKDVVRRVMEVESDVSLLPSPIAGVDVYRVLRTDDPGDFEAELFEDLGLGLDEGPERQPPLLNQWAIAVVPSGNGDQGHLVFSSHPEMLLETLARFAQPDPSTALANNPQAQEAVAQLQQLGGDERLYARISRNDRTLRAKYALLQQGTLRDSDSVMASLFRRIFIEEDIDDELLQNDKLPPFERIQKYFRPAGAFSRATDAGWTLDGFLLK